MNTDEQDSKLEKKHFIEWSKELWFALLFICVGWTVWPLMIYFLGGAFGIEYFKNLSLREWAENKVYGPLAHFSLRSLVSFIFLFIPWLLCLLIRLLLFFARRI